MCFYIIYDCTCMMTKYDVKHFQFVGYVNTVNIVK